MNRETHAMQKVLKSAVIMHPSAPSEHDAPLRAINRLRRVSIADVHSNPSPPPQFAWEGYLPFGLVSMLGAHGGTGKSTIGLMLNVSVALGMALFDVSTKRCKTLFVSLEDSEAVVRHRLGFICSAWKIDPKILDEQMTIVDGTLYPELFTAETHGDGGSTATYFEMQKLIEEEGYGLVLIDNASDAFGGDEIKRRQVRAFIRSLGHIAASTNCAVLLLAHVDKNTSRMGKAENGEGYSGSTAWHNSVRSRMFMTREKDGALTLEHQKSNHGKMHEIMTLEWPEGGLPQLARGDQSAFGDRASGRAEDERAAALLRLIAEYESRQQFCGSGTTSTKHVYAVLKTDPEFKRLKLNQDDTKRIVTQCQRANWIEPLEYRTPDRKPHTRWTLTKDGYAFAGILAPTAPTAPSSVVGAGGADGAGRGAPTAPSSMGGVGGSARTQDGAEGGLS